MVLERPFCGTAEIWAQTNKHRSIGDLSRFVHHRRVVNGRPPGCPQLDERLALKSTAERRALGPTAIPQSEKRAGFPAMHGPTRLARLSFPAGHGYDSDCNHAAHRAPLDRFSAGGTERPIVRSRPAVSGIFLRKMVRCQMSDQTEYCNTATECGGSSRCGLPGPHGTTWGTTRAGWATSL